MAPWDIGMSHIVDVDGQLLAIDAAVIDATALLARANCPLDRHLLMVRAGERYSVQPGSMIRLARDEVLFFESSPACSYALPERLAA